MAQLKRISDGAVFTTRDNPQWLSGTWFCGDQNFMDPSGTNYEVIAKNYVPLIVSRQQFLMSLTAVERAALRAHGDPLVKEFAIMVNDSSIQQYDLNLPSFQFDVQYACGLVVAPAGAANAGQLITNPPILNGATRAPQILSGDVLAAGN